MQHEEPSTSTRSSNAARGALYQHEELLRQQGYRVTMLEAGTVVGPELTVAEGGVRQRRECFKFALAAG